MQMQQKVNEDQQKFNDGQQKFNEDHKAFNQDQRAFNKEQLAFNADQRKANRQVLYTLGSIDHKLADTGQHEERIRKLETAVFKS